MRVLGIETSCDETAVAIYDSDHGLLAHCLYSQINLHNRYGGVVPELASRDHIRKLVPLVQQTLEKASLHRFDIDGIAYTKGPGLIGALLVGATFSRSLAWAWEIPSIGIHHMEAHLLATLLESEIPSFPFIALLVSGGHTLLIQVNEIGQYQWLGETLDDAVGEAFDKTAKILGLSYPGGPQIAELAKKGRADRYHFPRPMLDRPGLDFSFSGLKTYALNTWQSSLQDQQSRCDIAYAFQEAVVDTLSMKCQRALEANHIQQLVVAGGVGANVALRQRLQEMMKKFDGKVFYPRPEFCTDNGAMVALTGYHRLRMGCQDDLEINVRPRWSLLEI